MVSSAVLFVPFARMASTGSHRGPHSRSRPVRYRCRPPKGRHRASRRQLRFRRRHVLSVDGAVDVMRTSECHQIVGHVVDGDDVLVFCGNLVGSMGDVDDSGGIDVIGGVFSMDRLWQDRIVERSSRRFSSQGF